MFGMKFIVRSLWGNSVYYFVISDYFKNGIICYCIFYKVGKNDILRDRIIY